MGRLIFTNNQMWNNKLKAIFSKYGMRINGEISEDIYLVSYRKINVANYSFFSRDSRFVATAGTISYKGRRGEKALNDLLEDLYSYKLVDVRKELVGSYVVIYGDKEHVKVFVDETGSYAFYYYVKDREYLFTNTWFHIQLCAQQEYDWAAIAEELMCYCIIDNKTPVKNIYRIQNDECIVIDRTKNTVSHEVIECSIFHLTATNVNDCVEKLCSSFNRYQQKLACITEDLFLCSTGGLDSRTILATHIANDKRPVLLTWRNNPLYMNAKEEDFSISEMLSAKLKIDFLGPDVHQVDDTTYLDKDYLLLLGEYATLYNCNQNWLRLMKQYNIQYIDQGYFGETLKGWELLDKQSKSRLSLDEYVDIYINRSGILDGNIIPFSEELRLIIKNKWQAICNKLKINDTQLTKEDCMTLYSIYRLHADTKYCNYANMYAYSFNSLTQKELLDLINDTPYAFKEHGRLELLIQQKQCKDVLTVPYFTHQHIMNFDPNKMELFDTNRNKLKSKLLSYKMIRFLNRLRKKGVASTKNDLKRSLIKKQLEKISNLKVYCDSNFALEKYQGENLVFFGHSYVWLEMLEAANCNNTLDY